MWCVFAHACEGSSDGNAPHPWRCRVTKLGYNHPLLSSRVLVHTQQADGVYRELRGQSQEITRCEHQQTHHNTHLQVRADAHRGWEAWTESTRGRTGPPPPRNQAHAQALSVATTVSCKSMVSDEIDNRHTRPRTALDAACASRKAVRSVGVNRRPADAMPGVNSKKRHAPATVHSSRCHDKWRERRGGGGGGRCREGC